MSTFFRLALFIMFIFNTIEARALEFKTGVYFLVKGDEKICDEGPLLIKGDQLSLGARLTFVNYKTPIMEFMNDEKDCQYSIKNNHDQKSYEQQMTVKCQKAAPYTRTIRFHYEGDKLIMELIEKNKTHTCELKWKK